MVGQPVLCEHTGKNTDVSHLCECELNTVAAQMLKNTQAISDLS